MKSRPLARAALLACVLLTGCNVSIPQVTPQMDAQLMNSLQTGQAVLNCQFACSMTWGASLENLRQRDAGGDWHGLALAVMQIGYASDLAYYYLGHAAEGMGAAERVNDFETPGLVI